MDVGMTLVRSVDRQGSRCKKSKNYSCALQQVTTEIPEVSSDETRYSSVVAQQSRVERLDLCQLWLTV
jgi:hypothetical protein